MSHAHVTICRLTHFEGGCWSRLRIYRLVGSGVEVRIVVRAVVGWGVGTGVSSGVEARWFQESGIELVRLSEQESVEEVESARGSEMESESELSWAGELTPDYVRESELSSVQESDLEWVRLSELESARGSELEPESELS